jgi:hypothetical protein
MWAIIAEWAGIFQRKKPGQAQEPAPQRTLKLDNLELQPGLNQRNGHFFAVKFFQLNLGCHRR